MYTDPIIVHSDNLKTRSYVKFYIAGTRYRFYNGKALDIQCNPNLSQNPVERMRLLQSLQYEIKKKLEKGWRPYHVQQQNPYQDYTLYQCISVILKAIKEEDLSDYYKRDMGLVGEEIQSYLRKKKLTAVSIKAVTSVMIEPFLDTFRSSATYYMTKRSSLSGIFSRMVRKGMIAENPVHKTLCRKSVPVLNTIFKKDQLRKILQFLNEKDTNLYLCSLLMFGCFLRPHREVRLLQRRHLSDDCTTITLGGNENKSKRIRVVRLPKYVTDELLKRQLQHLSSEHYIISQSTVPFNKDYFKTRWGRWKKKLTESCGLTSNQTLYSFRHTGAVEIYNKTKDPYKVQKAMFHSSLSTTLVYLRSLGLSVENNTDDLPEI